MSESTEQKLHAALAREARLREALDDLLSYTIQVEIAAYGEGSGGTDNDVVARALSALSPSPLADAAAEVLEAAGPVVDYGRVTTELVSATTRYRALLRGEAGGEETQ